MNLKDFIAIYESPNPITVEEIKDLNWEKGLWQNANGEVSGEQQCHMTFDYDNFLGEKLVSSCHMIASHYASRFGFQITGGYNPRFNKYNVGERMELHQDHASSIFEDARGIPIISMIGILNEDYLGGEVTFHLGEEKFTPEVSAGNVLVFPSAFPWKHEVKKVIEGIKYSWVTWAW
tara:strand:+ start:625 stop:1155 length:531 start_codon:yes stop_codon:yes gene_type:complete